MQRIVFVNLHANEFLVKTLSKMVWKQSCAFKHKYFLEYLLQDPNIEVYNYVNPLGFSLIQSIRFFQLFRNIEARYVLRKNGISSKQVKMIKKKDIRPDDIVIGYRHVPSSLSDMEDIKAFKAVSLIHFLGTNDENILLQKAHPDVLFNEGNLQKFSKMFNHFFSWYRGPFITYPFVAAPRFKRNTSFSERECRVFSTGTITYRELPEHIEVYGESCLQPIRREILVNANELEPLIACYNSEYMENTRMKEYLPTDNIFAHYYKVWYNMRHTGQQKKYFSFDMVERFNHFKMFMIGEEIMGLPGIGFVEGMACGCAYIGQNCGFYEEYGMKEGIHYIGYDGTLDDLKAKISYYQQPENQVELERIANAGYEFAQSHFKGEIVAKELLDKLQKAQAEWVDRKSWNTNQ